MVLRINFLSFTIGTLSPFDVFIRIYETPVARVWQNNDLNSIPSSLDGHLKEQNL